MPLKPEQLLDPMPETRKYYRRRVRNCPIDFKSFGISLRQCRLEDCHGLCCYNGVCLDEDEEHYIGAIVDAHPVFFKEMGIDRESAFEDAVFLDSDCRKTSTVKYKYPKHVGRPKHFDKTKCIFRYDDGRCSLQTLAMEHGEHPWAYKPPSCWLHPISLERNDKTILWLPTKETDHVVDDDYPGYSPYTPCGEDCQKGGMPAYEALKDELMTLGAIVGRDFYGEIKAWHEEKRTADKKDKSGKKS